MRSYYAHLETAIGEPKAAISPRPIYRSSAIFPVIHTSQIQTRIIFLGYWLLKRHIKEISSIITLRTEEGKVVARRLESIQEAKTYRFEVEDLLAIAGLSPDAPYTGSIEIEFYSTSNLVFPYPAVAVNYYGDHFSSIVHTAQRTYNDFEDMRNNSQTQVPESGFNIYADDDQEPFFGMVNGGESIPQTKVHITFYNHSRDVLEHELDLGETLPYQTRIIYPARLVDLKRFLGGSVGAAKVQFQLKWVFPRLLVGNINHKLPAVTITHTYYDCTQAASQSDYWKKSEPQWHPASLMIPLTITEDHFTNIYFYPIYSPSTFVLDIEIYDDKGKLLGGKREALIIKSPEKGYYQINFKELCQELKIKPERFLAARIIAKEKEGKPIPARIKLGLDLGYKNPQLPCNICTNLQPFNPAVEGKPKSFKWAPILADQPNAYVWIMNSAPHVDYKKDALVELTFFHEQDTSTLVRKVELPPHGFIVISVADDPELKSFFQGNIGWFTATTSNPYTTTYYFAENNSGVIGGDHGF